MSFGFGASTGGASTFSFGGAAATPAATPFSLGSSTASATPSTGFSFGSSTAAATTTTPSTGFSFGSSTGGFGSTATSTTTTPATATGFGGFGTASKTPTTGFGGFGSTGTASTTPTTGFGGFGGFGAKPPATTPAAGGFGGFGSLGATTPTSTGLGGFGAAAPAAAPDNTNSIEGQVGAIATAYNPTHPGCRFQHIFYNTRHPKEVAAQKAQPPANINKRLWTQAMQNNPDPVNLALEQASSFEDLKARIQKQDSGVDVLNTHLSGLQATLDSMAQKHEETKTAIASVRKEYTKQSLRLLKVMTNIEMDRARGQSLTTQEIDYLKQLQNLARRLEKPGHFKSKVSELESLVSRQRGGRPSDQPYLNLDQTPSSQLFQFLQVQKESLAYLTAVLKKDLADADTVVQGLEQEIRAQQGTPATTYY